MQELKFDSIEDERPLKVLVACEYSQVVCRQFRALGHEAYNCDLLEPDPDVNNAWYIKGDVVPLLDGDCRFKTMDGKEHVIEGEWDLIVAHPTCTYFCSASACRLFHRDKTTGESKLNVKRYRQGLQMKKLFMACLKAKCRHIAVENPTPMGIWDLPEESQVIQPWMFGDAYTKRTLLWLKGLPKLKAEITEKPENVGRWVNAGTRKDGIRTHDNAPARSSKERSRTFEGIARAMAKQWGPHVSAFVNSGLDDALRAIEEGNIEVQSSSSEANSGVVSEGRTGDEM